MELAGVAAAPREVREYRAVVAAQEPDVIVLAVRRVQERLSAVGREVQIPHGAASQGGGGDQKLLHERAVLPEHLDAIVAAVADIDEPVGGDAHAVDRILE